ncbi:hypothetical protein RND71_028694 [Anisodus tanguticus]|uniref:Uncharacterized protein n=1 Tax=Anisodus tanguticus TaxID=243964 RepID=A0AAE1RK81_9SOLA|nr:hypothetical protein RND71_028694 [Anisodus tanguticus]
MAIRIQVILIASLLLLGLDLPLAFAYDHGLAQPVETTVVIEGMVYCQSCDTYGSWSLSEAKPIASAKISVICKDYKKRVNFYKAFETNAYGYFYVELQGFKMGHSYLDHPLHSCRVKLVSSPQENCNVFSNINYGFNGAPLRFDDKVIDRSDYKALQGDKERLKGGTK